MELNVVFDNSQLAHIIDQAMIYQCACPGQVAQHILGLRELFRYQTSCRAMRSEDFGVHARDGSLPRRRAGRRGLGHGHPDHA